MGFRYFASAALIAGLFVSQAAEAAEAARAAENAYHLSPIIVTATRMPQHQDDTLAATTVITREDIERLQPQSVQELLRWTPGISVSNSGGPGKLTSIHMRGTNSTHTLVLVNGVRYASATAGLPAIADIPVSHIKRIEIVRGPLSSLYGADAIGGVIQIFTRDGADIENGLQPYATVGGGSNGTYSATAGLSGRHQDGHFNLTVSRKKTDGFNACRGKPFPNGGGCFVDQPDDDRYARTAVSLRGGFSPVDDVEVNAHALRIESEVQSDGSFTDNSQGVRQVLGVSIARQFADAWRTALSLGREVDDTDNYAHNGEPRSSFKTTINTARWQNDITLSANHRFTLGVDYRGTQIDTTVDYDDLAKKYDDTERDTVGAFAQYLGTFGDHEIQLALRGDDHEAFDDSVTGTINYGWHLDSVHTITAAYGTAYNVPNFNYLYYPRTPFFDSSNPDLEPEQSESYELGFKADRAWGGWAVYVYQNQIDDLIVANARTGYYPKNISKARIRGVEASVDAAFGAWYVNASADYVDAENRSNGSNRGHQLAHRPQYSAALRVGRQFGAFSAGTSVAYGGSRYEGAGNDVKLDDFVLVGLRGSWNVTDEVQLRASIDNLFDADYETVQYYNQAGRTFFLSLSYRP